MDQTGAKRDPCPGDTGPMSDARNQTRQDKNVSEDYRDQRCQGESYYRR